MMVYTYRGSLLCRDCGEAMMEKLFHEGKAPDDPADESSFDSDQYPKGPVYDGGGEADKPQHCDKCGKFLENPLSFDGVSYVRERIADGDDSDAVRTWKSFYDLVDCNEAIRWRRDMTRSETAAFIVEARCRAENCIGAFGRSKFRSNYLSYRRSGLDPRRASRAVVVLLDIV